MLPPLAVECKVMDLMLAAPEGVTTHTVDSQEEKVWRDWEETVEWCRLHIGRPESWDTRFCAGLANVLSPMERLALPGGRVIRAWRLDMFRAPRTLFKTRRTMTSATVLFRWRSNPRMEKRTGVLLASA